MDVANRKRCVFRRAILMVFCLVGVHAVYSDDPLQIVTTGDSLTNGYSPYLSTSCGNLGLDVSIVKVANGGLTSSQYVGETLNSHDTELRDYAGDVLAADPDVICFMLGTNDVYHNSNAATKFEEYATRISGVFTRFQAAVNTSGEHPRVIVSTIIPITLEGKEAANQRIDEWYNPWLASAADAFGFTLLDVNSRIQQLPDWTSLYSDGVHLHANGDAGCIWMADEFAAVIAAPEPGILGLLTAGFTAMCARRRRT